MSHSPTPWIFEHRDGDHPLNDQRGWGVNGLWEVNGGLILGDATGWDGGFEPPSEENATFIVRAVNAHDDLVAACEELCRWAVDNPGEAMFTAVPMAMAALLKAKETT